MHKCNINAMFGLHAINAYLIFTNQEFCYFHIASVKNAV